MNSSQNHNISKINISILGAGESGIGAAILAKQKGFTVFVSDLGEIKPKYKIQLQELGVDFESGSHDEGRILSSDLIIKSPGIPDTTPLILKAVEKGISVISEIEFASRYTKSRIIAITGSNGKTTTTLLTYHILKEAGLNVGIAGNIGDSFAKQVAEKSIDYYVLELSSFQLDGIEDFKPLVSVILNITPDHLDRYDYKFENYIDSKFRITKNQTKNDVCIYWEDDKSITSNIEKINAVAVPYCEGYQSDDFQLQGRHNELNANAAYLAAMSVGVQDEIIEKAINSFQSVKHRLQSVKKIDGVEYINDSKATNVDAVYYAIEGIEKPIWWIVGGVDKGNDYSVLFPFLDKIKGVVALGKDNQKLIDTFSDRVEVFESTSSMKDAIEIVSSKAMEGDVILLSPACASFDLFNSYEHRGDEFIKGVESLVLGVKN